MGWVLIKEHFLPPFSKLLPERFENSFRWMTVMLHSFFPFLKVSVFVTIPQLYSGFGRRGGGGGGGEMILNGADNLSFLLLFISFCILSTYHKILPSVLNAMIGRKSWFLSLGRKGGKHHSMILCASHFLVLNGNVYYMDPMPVLTLYADSKGGR